MALYASTLVLGPLVQVALLLSLLLNTCRHVNAIQGGTAGRRWGLDWWGGEEARAVRHLAEAFGTKTVAGAMRARKASDECWSRTERHLYHQAMAAQSSPAFVNRLRAYEHMHRRCAMDVEDWGKFMFPSGKDQGLKPGANVTGCRYLLFGNFDAVGLGNQLLALVSAFAYALITDRAFVMEPTTPAARLLCNPFAASHWAPGKGLERFHGSVRGSKASYSKLGPWLQDRKRSLRHLNAFLWYNYVADDKKFFCEEVQELIAPVTFLGLQADTYIVPALHFVPALQAEMARLFPDGQLFTHLARWLLHPNNVLWERITRFHQTYLAGHHETVGIQVRTFVSEDRGTEARVLTCARDVAKYLPPTVPFDAYSKGLEQEGEKRAPSRKIAAFVTSLHLEHAEYLRMVYADARAADGALVSIHRYTAEGKEKHRNLGQAGRAVVEIWLLSFCSKLLVSEHSTFGAVAAGLAGVPPYVMNIGVRNDVIRGDWHTDNRSACAPAGADPCFFTSPKALTCARLPKEDFKVLPYIGRCAAIGYGLAVGPLPSAAGAAAAADSPAVAASSSDAMSPVPS